MRESQRASGEVGFRREEITDWHPEDFRQDFEVFVGHRRALGLDARQDVPRHVAVQHLQFPDQIRLRPPSLVAKLGYGSSDDIRVALHNTYLLHG
jgi:hypothetical protein